jgi:hypothetical protein
MPFSIIVTAYYNNVGNCGLKVSIVYDKLLSGLYWTNLLSVTYRYLPSKNIKFGWPIGSILYKNYWFKVTVEPSIAIKTTAIPLIYSGESPLS